jgi:hypothetical protein
MKVLKATQAQYDALNGYTNGHDQLIFTKDGNDNWIVGTNVLQDPAFSAIHAQLNELEIIDYVPPVEAE